MDIIIVLNLRSNKVGLFSTKSLAAKDTECNERTVARAIISGKVVKGTYLFSVGEVEKLKKQKRQHYFISTANIGVV